jgi:predicted transglutaminase-like cysteine proteinase
MFRLVLLALLVSSPALAGRDDEDRAALAAVFPVSEGGGLYPPGFDYYCAERPALCEPAEAVPAISASDWLATIERVNYEVNRAIVYKLDESQPEGDRWTVEPTEGDCDDYAITKMHRLMDAGIPRAAMRMAFVFPLDDPMPHLLLIISTDAGNLALDNRRDEIVQIEQLILDGVSMQDATNPRIWRVVY